MEIKDNRKIKDNKEFELFKSLPQHNKILNWFADMNDDVRNAIYTLQSALPKKMIRRCQKDKKFEKEKDDMSASLNFYDEGELELIYENEDGEEYSLNIEPFTQKDIDEMDEEDFDDYLKSGITIHELAAIEVSDMNSGISAEYELTLHNVKGEMYLYLTRGAGRMGIGYDDENNVVKKRIPSEELEDYFGRKTTYDID